MSEEELLNDIFGGAKWKDKYFVDWCELCDVAIITCPECKNSSCNGGGCEKCNEDFNDFNKNKTQVEDYLTEPDITVYQKSLSIKKFILKSLSEGEAQIPFKKYEKDGKFSRNDEVVLSSFL